MSSVDYYQSVMMSLIVAGLFTLFGLFGTIEEDYSPVMCTAISRLVLVLILCWYCSSSFWILNEIMIALLAFKMANLIKVHRLEKSPLEQFAV